MGRVVVKVRIESLRDLYALRNGDLTPEQVRNFAAKYLVPANRTLINRVPAPAEKSSSALGGNQ